MWDQGFDDFVDPCTHELWESYLNMSLAAEQNYDWDDVHHWDDDDHHWDDDDHHWDDNDHDWDQNFAFAELGCKPSKDTR